LVRVAGGYTPAPDTSLVESKIAEFTLLDAQATPIEVGGILSFAKTYARSAIINFSLRRGIEVESGYMDLTHDGTEAKVSVEGTPSDDNPDIMGCEFTAEDPIALDDIVRVLYTSTATGTGLTMIVKADFYK
jgi:hypothetical protein